MVEGSVGNPNCDWRWIRIKKRFDTEADARTWINDNAGQIIALGLHSEEPFEE
jgi:hypothetical protein